MSEKVSVLMSIYKEPMDWILDSVGSILKQTYENIELVLISDNPEYSELNRYLKKLSASDYRVVAVFNDTNIGLVKSLNKGIKYCSGEYIARMDADDISFNTRIEMQMKYMKERAYDLVGCQFCVFRDKEELGISNAPTTDSACSIVLKYKSCIAHPSWLGKKMLFEVLGGYRDIDACEDLDFLQRAISSGYRLGNHPEVLLKYRDNANSISHKKEFCQHAIRRRMARALYRNKILSESEYNCYISSVQYQQDIKKYEKIKMWDTQFKESRCLSKKILALFYLLKEPFFVEEKIWNKRINSAIKAERMSVKQ